MEKSRGLNRSSYFISFQRLVFSIVVMLIIVGCGQGQQVNRSNTSTTYSISGIVLDDNDTPIEGATVALHTSDDRVAATTVTDANGGYEFSGLPKGEYSVVAHHTGYQFATLSRTVVVDQASITDLTAIGTATPSTGTALTAAATTLIISGRVVDAANSPVSGVAINLSGDATANTITNANGRYSFTALAAGKYTVTPSLNGQIFTPVSRVVTISRFSARAVNFKSTPLAANTNTYSISGRVSFAASGLGGVTLTLTGANTGRVTTDANGNFTFAALVNGTYTVTPNLTGYTFAPTNRTATVNNANVANINYTATANTSATYTLSGRVTKSDGTSLSGVSIALSGPATTSATTDNSGNYSVSGLAAGNYVVTPMLTGYTFTPVRQNVQITTTNVTTIDFVGVQPQTTTYTISGQITAGANIAVSGATVTLSGTATSTVTSDTRGNYTFVNLANGSYTVTPTKTGYTFAPTKLDVTVNGANVINTNFSGVGPPDPAIPPSGATFTVSGKITDGTTGVPGIVVALNSNTSVTVNTDTNGNYSFTNVANGSYTVQPMPMLHTISPTSTPVTVNGANITNINFTATPFVAPLFGVISGRIATASGVSVSGIDLILTTAPPGMSPLFVAATATTDMNGHYSFSRILNGTYYVVPNNMPGYSFDPASKEVLMNNADVNNIDFVAVPPTPRTRNYILYIVPGTLTVNGRGGATIPAWSFTDVATTPKFPGAALTVTEGDTVNVLVQNDNLVEHNFVINGITTTTGNVAPGTSKTYTFTATKAGTYLYYDSLNNNVNREMGLYGAIVVNPVNRNAVWTDGPIYNLQRLWVTSDMDKTRWNEVAYRGATVDTSAYKADYFLINGMGGEDAMLDKINTAIDGSVGLTALVRILNAGQYPQTFHFHANHVQVISVNGVRRTAPYKLLDVLQVPPLGSTEVLFKLNQPGTYPMHNHTAQMETANGAYLNGVSTMIYINP